MHMLLEWTVSVFLITVSLLMSGIASAGTTPTPTPPTGSDFTLVALPDTQFYVSSLNGGLPAMFTSQTDWIVTNRPVRNIAYVAQLGDCVQNGDNGGNNTEWLEATNALYRLENPNTTFMPDVIPYGVAVGNHDQSPNGSATGTTTFYNQCFGEAHFLPYNYYGGHYGADNDNHYDLFSASGLDFIVIYFEYNATMTIDSPVLAWANSLLQAHQNRRAIVVSHWIINNGFNATFSSQGQAIYNALKSNPNLFLMLCGHVTPPEGQRTDSFNGHTTWSVLSDYQSRAGGGNGWLRLYEFSPSNNVIHVKTYSPWLDQFETDADSQFNIPYIMTATPTPTPSLTPTPSPTATATATPTVSPPTPTPCPIYNISGRVGQCTTAGPSGVALQGVTITRTISGGGGDGSTTTDENGDYFSSTFGCATNTFTPNKSARLPSSTGIDTVDTVAVQRHFLGTLLLTGCRLTAADCASPTGVTTADAIAIQRFFLGLTTGTGNVGHYSFTPASRSYSLLFSDQTGQNYDTIVFGDVVAPFAVP